MDPIATRLNTCFQTVFPDLPPKEIPTATQSSLATWDSTSAIMLLNVIEEEFEIVVDFDLVAELDSFNLIHKYLTGVVQGGTGGGGAA
jgi:acyl carrier protein